MNVAEEYAELLIESVVERMDFRVNPEILVESANKDFHELAGVCLLEGILNEATYKELVQLIDGDFLSQRIRAKMLKHSVLKEITDDGMLIFHVPSSEYHRNGIIYKNRVKFDQWEAVVKDMDLNSAEAARMLLWAGDIRLHCDCPSFLYHGYAYLLTAMDADIVPEDRPPKIRNPEQRGIVCKHLNLTLQVLPFNSRKIANKIKELRKSL